MDSASGTHEYPAEIEMEIARVRLATLGITIDSRTAEQLEYLMWWQHWTQSRIHPLHPPTPIHSMEQAHYVNGISAN